MLNREAGIFCSGVETERRLSVGVALVVVGIDPSRNEENITTPKLWTVIENRTNLQTEKVAGQISFPGETSKIGEDLQTNILGAVAEEFSGDVKQISNLWYVRGRSHMEGKVLLGGRPADLVVLAFTGSLEDPNIPLATNEVSPNKWMTVEELLKEHPDNVRKFARETAALEKEHRLIGQVINEFMRSSLTRISLLEFVPKDVSSMTQLYQNRSRRKDIDAYTIPLGRY